MVEKYGRLWVEKGKISFRTSRTFLIHEEMWLIHWVLPGIPKITCFNSPNVEEIANFIGKEYCIRDANISKRPIIPKSVYDNKFLDLLKINYRWRRGVRKWVNLFEFSLWEVRLKGWMQTKLRRDGCKQNSAIKGAYKFGKWMHVLPSWSCFWSLLCSLN